MGVQHTCHLVGGWTFTVVQDLLGSRHSAGAAKRYVCSFYLCGLATGATLAPDIERFFLEYFLFPTPLELVPGVVRGRCCREVSSSVIEVYASNFLVSFLCRHILWRWILGLLLKYWTPI